MSQERWKFCYILSIIFWWIEQDIWIDMSAFQNFLLNHKKKGGKKNVKDFYSPVPSTFLYCYQPELRDSDPTGSYVCVVANVKSGLE